MLWVAARTEADSEGLPRAAKGSTILNVPFGLIGLSNSSWASYELPRDLAMHGMPGCTQYASVEFAFTLVNSGGMATWEIPIPNLPDLVGVTFYTQALVLDFGVNAFNGIVSNAGEGLIGAR